MVNQPAAPHHQLGLAWITGVDAVCDRCHTLPRKDNTIKPIIIIRFVNRKAKAELLSQARKLRGTNVFLNDHLTKKNADTARQARILKKTK